MFGVFAKDLVRRLDACRREKVISLWWAIEVGD